MRRLFTILFVPLACIALLYSARVAAQVPSTLGVSLGCVSAGNGRLDCETTVDGGTAPYSFAWSPAPMPGRAQGMALIACNFGQFTTVSVTVTDANGETASDSGSFYCGAGQ